MAEAIVPAQAISLIRTACGAKGVGGVEEALGVGVSERVGVGVIVIVAVAVGLGSTAVEVGEVLGVGEGSGSPGVRLGIGLDVGVVVGSTVGDGLAVSAGVAVGSPGSSVGVSEVSLADSARNKCWPAAGPSWANTKTTIPKTAPTCLSIWAGHGVLNASLLSRFGGG